MTYDRSLDSRWVGISGWSVVSGSIVRGMDDGHEARRAACRDHRCIAARVLDLRDPSRSRGARPNIVVLMLDDIAEMDTRIWSRLGHINARYVRRGLRLTQTIGETLRS
jgi:predicted nuclease of predicted toxin-antitoxin system